VGHPANQLARTANGVFPILGEAIQHIALLYRQGSDSGRPAICRRLLEGERFHNTAEAIGHLNVRIPWLPPNRQRRGFYRHVPARVERRE
jgi:hypothetical protein